MVDIAGCICAFVVNQIDGHIIFGEMINGRGVFQARVQFGVDFVRVPVPSVQLDQTVESEPGACRPRRESAA